MAKFKVLESCRDQKNHKTYEKSETCNVTIKEIEDFEKRLKARGYKQKFFERVKK